MNITDIPLETLLSLRKTTKPNAARILGEYGLSEIDYATAMELAGKDISETASASVDAARHWQHKRLWRASAYLLGGSLGQIATLDGVARSTVNESLRQELGMNRNTQRIANKIPGEHLSAHLRTFNANLNVLYVKTPMEAAQWILSKTDLD